MWPTREQAASSIRPPHSQIFRLNSYCPAPTYNDFQFKFNKISKRNFFCPYRMYRGHHRMHQFSRKNQHGWQTGCRPWLVFQMVYLDAKRPIELMKLECSGNLSWQFLGWQHVHWENSVVCMQMYRSIWYRLLAPQPFGLHQNHHCRPLHLERKREIKK